MKNLQDGQIFDLLTYIPIQEIFKYKKLSYQQKILIASKIIPLCFIIGGTFAFILNSTLSDSHHQKSQNGNTISTLCKHYTNTSNNHLAALEKQDRSCQFYTKQ